MTTFNVLVIVLLVCGIGFVLWGPKLMGTPYQESVLDEIAILDAMECDDAKRAKLRDTPANSQVPVDIIDLDPSEVTVRTVPR